MVPDEAEYGLDDMDSVAMKHCLQHPDCHDDNAELYSYEFGQFGLRSSRRYIFDGGTNRVDREIGDLR